MIVIGDGYDSHCDSLVLLMYRKKVFEDKEKGVVSNGGSPVVKTSTIKLDPATKNKVDSTYNRLANPTSFHGVYRERFKVFFPFFS